MQAVIDYKLKFNMDNNSYSFNSDAAIYRAKSFFNKYGIKQNLKNCSPSLMWFGTSLKNFLTRSRPGKEKIECCVKILILIHQFYDDPTIVDEVGNHKPFFVSTTSLHKRLSQAGSEYSLRWVQKCLNKLQNEGLIIVENYKWVKDESNKNHHIKRNIYMNMDKVHKLLSIYSEDDPAFKELPKRSILRKIVRKRPYGYIDSIEDKFDASDKVNSHSSYEYLAWFVATTTAKYSKHNLFNKYKPKNITNLQKYVDERFVKADRPIAVDLLDVKYLEELHNKVSRSKKMLPKLIKEARKLIGLSVFEKSLVERLEPLGYILNDRSEIISYNYNSNYDSSTGEVIGCVFNTLNDFEWL